MNRSFLLPSLALVVLLTTACTKETDPQPQLPAATQTGQNTAGCRVNGRVWLPAGDFLVSGAPVRAVYQRVGPTYQLTILLERLTDEAGDPLGQTAIRLSAPDVPAPATFTLNQPADPRLGPGNPPYAAFTYAKPSPDQQLLTGPQTEGRLVITRLDTVARVVAGTFEFTGREQPAGASVQVTEGRFDVRF